MVRNQGKRKKQTIGGKRGSDKVGKMGWRRFSGKSYSCKGVAWNMEIRN